jgi:hypothetical protein
MTKNGRRTLFLLVATVANMLLTVIIIVIAFIGLNALAMALSLKNLGAGIIIVSFLAGVVLSGFAYSRVLKALHKRPDLEERFGLIK